MMVLYILSLLPLEKYAWEEEPKILQPCYAENASMMGPTERNARLLCSLIKVPFHGYFPYLDKIWRVYRTGKEEVASRGAFRAKAFDVK